MDFNTDGTLDLVAGDTEGNVTFFRNIGTAKAPKLAAGVKMEAGGKPIKGSRPRYERQPDGKFKVIPAEDSIIGTYSKLHVTDYDGDGLLDVLIGQDSPKGNDAQIVFYRNVGTAQEPKLAAPQPLKVLKKPLSRPSPYVVDWDGDGVRDLLLGTDGAQVMFLKNTGTDKQPQYADPEPLKLDGLNKCYRCRIAVTDWNNDGKLDLLVGTFYSQDGRGGNVWLFLRK